jgi:hypothetical protein
MPQPQLQGKVKPHDSAKGTKGNYGDRQWKSQNFPAAYNSEQANTALHEDSSPTQSAEWWQTNEIGSVLVEDDKNSIKNNDDEVAAHDELALAPIDEHDDDATAAYIDLIILAIFQNIERQQEYLKHPTIELLNAVTFHSQYNVRAESQLGMHTQRIYKTLKL